ncbi:MAG: hypothetical protein RIR70_1307, partial [Pseudomonadota bacterium]
LTGATGTDTLTVTSMSVSLTNAGTGTVGAMGFSGFERLVSAANNDSITASGLTAATVAGVGTATLTGSGGSTSISGFDSATLSGSAANNDTLSVSGLTVNLQANRAGSIGAMSFNGFETLTSSATDYLVATSVTSLTITAAGTGSVTDNSATPLTTQFNSFDGITVTGTAGNDTLDFHNLSQSVTADLTTGTITHGANSISTSSFESIIGSSVADTFTGALNGSSLDGSGGSDTLQYSSQVTVDLTGATKIAYGAAGTDSFTSIEQVVGSSSNDTFKIDSASPSVSLNGGAGSDTVEISGTGGSYDLATLSNFTSFMERLDFNTNANNDNITNLSADVIKQISGISNSTATLEIKLSSGDTLSLGAGQSMAEDLGGSFGSENVFNTGAGVHNYVFFDSAANFGDQNHVIAHLQTTIA